MTGRACDTSVLLPALASWHRHHDAAMAALRDEVTAVPGHVLLECFSVLTRLPAPHRIAGADAAAALAGWPLETIAPPPDVYGGLISDLAGRGVRGGAVYDGLVAATVKHHDLHLVTRDRRARPVYDAVGVAYTMI